MEEMDGRETVFEQKGIISKCISGIVTKRHCTVSLHGVSCHLGSSTPAAWCERNSSAQTKQVAEQSRFFFLPRQTFHRHKAETVPKHSSQLGILTVKSAMLYNLQGLMCESFSLLQTCHRWQYDNQSRLWVCHAKAENPDRFKSLIK